MITQTVKDADRHLLNNGLTLTKEVDLQNGQFQFSYTFGNLNAKPPDGISITLHDYGDGRWSYVNFVGLSKNLSDKARKITEALIQLSGFEPHTIAP